MKLVTERLYLEPMSLKDIDIFQSTNTDRFVRKYLWDDEIISIASSIDILKEIELLFRDEGWGLWKILRKEDEKYLGYVGLWKFFGEDQPQLLYALHKENCGHGYASEAAKEIINYAFLKLEYINLFAAMDIDNKDSIKLCKNIGMQFDRESIEKEKMTYFYKIEKT